MTLVVYGFLILELPDANLSVGSSHQHVLSMTSSCEDEVGSFMVIPNIGRVSSCQFHHANMSVLRLQVNDCVKELFLC